MSQIVLNRRPDTLVLGFAAETERVIEEGRRKLHEKGVDAIIANDVSQPDSGFEVERNGGTLLTHDGEFTMPTSSKRKMADRVLDYLASKRAARDSQAVSVKL